MLTTGSIVAGNRYRDTARRGHTYLREIELFEGEPSVGCAVPRLGDPVSLATFGGAYGIGEVVGLEGSNSILVRVDILRVGDTDTPGKIRVTIEPAELEKCFAEDAQQAFTLTLFLRRPGLTQEVSTGLVRVKDSALGVNR